MAKNSDAPGLSPRSVPQPLERARLSTAALPSGCTTAHRRLQMGKARRGGESPAQGPSPASGMTSRTPSPARTPAGPHFSPALPGLCLCSCHSKAHSPNVVTEDVPRSAPLLHQRVLLPRGPEAPHLRPHGAISGLPSTRGEANASSSRRLRRGLLSPPCHRLLTSKMGFVTYLPRP